MEKYEHEDETSLMHFAKPVLGFAAYSGTGKTTACGDDKACTP